MKIDLILIKKIPTNNILKKWISWLNNKKVSSLGISPPTPFDKALKETIEYYKKW